MNVILRFPKYFNVIVSLIRLLGWKVWTMLIIDTKLKTYGTHN